MELKIAAFTRGYERDFEWKASWKAWDDQEADQSTRALLSDYLLKDIIRSEDLGLVLAKKDNLFGLLFTGIHTDFRSARPGLITLGFSFFDLDEVAARGITKTALNDWGRFSQELASFVVRHSPSETASEWSIDVDRLDKYVTRILEEKGQSPRNFEFRRSRPYSKPELPEFSNYSKLISESAFTADSGVKVVIGKPYSGESEQGIRENSDFFAIPGAENSDRLPEKKNSKPTPSQKSTKQSRHSSMTADSLPKGGDFPRKVRRRKRISKNIFAIFCGVLLIGILLSQTCKKKGQEPPKPEPPKTPIPAPDEK